MDKIAEGSAKLFDVLDSFYKDLMITIELVKTDKNKDAFITDKSCKSCDGKMKKKISKFGVYLSCQNYPNCGYTISIDENGKEIEKNVETGKACTVCNSKVVKRKGPKGFFYGCSSYPTCTWAASIGENEEIIEKKPQEKTGEKCDKCGEGDMIKKEGRFGAYISCDNYPKCKNNISIKDGKKVEKKTFTKSKGPAPEKIGRKCPKCKEELLRRDGRFGAFISCQGFKDGCKYTEKIGAKDE